MAEFTRENIEELEMLRERLNTTSVGGAMLEIPEWMKNAIVENRKLQMMTTEGTGIRLINNSKWSRPTPQSSSGEKNRFFSSPDGKEDGLSLEIEKINDRTNATFRLGDDHTPYTQYDTYIGIEHGIEISSINANEVNVEARYIPTPENTELQLPNRGVIRAFAREIFDEKGNIENIIASVDIIDYPPELQDSQVKWRVTPIVARIMIESMEQLADFLRRENIYAIAKANMHRLEDQEEKGRTR